MAEEKKETRTRILDAGKRLLDRENGENWTLEDLAKEAGVSRMTVYRYFSNKETLFRMLQEERDVEGGWDLRTKIFRGARQIFGKVGFEKATMEEIAEASGVGVVSVYRAFGEKRALIEAFVQELRPWDALLSLEQESTGDIEIDLRRLATALLQQVSDKRDLINLFFMERMQENRDGKHRLPPPGQTFRFLHEFFESQLQAGRLKGGNSEEITIAFLGLLFGFAWMVPTMRGKPLQDAESTGSFVTQIFLHGLTEPSPTTKEQNR